MQGPRKSLCPFPLSDKEVITGLRYQGRHLPLIPPSQSHLRHSGPHWAQGGGPALVKGSPQHPGPSPNALKAESTFCP